MLRKILPVLAVSIALAMFAGCACAGTTVTPTPSPTAKPVATPDMTTSPSVAPSTSPDNSPATGEGTGTETTTISNFKEGTEVKDTDVPELKQAIEDKYPDAEIVSIKHAMQDNQQVYAAVIKTNGTEQTVYILPDGTLMNETSATPKQ